MSADDQHHILPRFFARQQQAVRQRELADIVAKAAANTQDQRPNVATVAQATLPGDQRRLRGIPVVGGVSGTSPGTDPLAATLANESARLRNAGSDAMVRFS